MQQATLVRVLRSTSGTFGVLSIDEIPFCLTLEPPVPMPEGQYTCIPHSSKDHPNTFEITEVPGHTAVLIHNGNTKEDTLLCVLVGSSFDMLKGRTSGQQMPGIVNSDITMMRLRSKVTTPFSLKVCSAMQTEISDH